MGAFPAKCAKPQRYVRVERKPKAKSWKQRSGSQHVAQPSRSHVFVYFGDQRIKLSNSDIAFLTIRSVRHFSSIQPRRQLTALFGPELINGFECSVCALKNLLCMPCCKGPTYWQKLCAWNCCVNVNMPNLICVNKKAFYFTQPSLCPIHVTRL